jgi:opacity protein-like surface antigen
MKRLCFSLLFLLSSALAPAGAGAQAIATATGPGSYVAVGGGISGFQTDYGQSHIAGGLIFLDAQPHWRVGLESEARYLRWHAQQEVTESNYLGGVRVILWRRPSRWAPYAKFLAGAGKVSLPFGYAHGGFLTYAPGAGLDVALSDRLSVRAVDVEYQSWPQFTYGELHPYGVSAGISLRLNGISRYPKGARARH